jgi:hypothetical protein
MIYDLVNDIQVYFFKRSERLANFARPVMFDQRLSLPRSSCGIWKELQKQWVITAGSIVQFSEQLPKNRPLSFLKNNVPKAAVTFEVLLRVVGARYSPCQLVSTVEVGRSKMRMRRFNGQRDEGA